MSGQIKRWLTKLRDGVEWLLALRMTSSERLRYAHYDLFDDGTSSRRPLQVATTIAILFHILLFLIVLPAWGTRVFMPTEQVLMLKNLAPGPIGGGGSKPKAAPPKTVSIPKPEPITMPIPDPTPNEPEPIRKAEVPETPQVVKEIVADLSIGDVSAPPGPAGFGGQGVGTGTGTGIGAGSGSGSGDGDGAFAMGTAGLTDPVIIVKTTPTYTDEAIRAKVQGVVLLQAVIRRNGRVDSPRVLKGLGYGLEERAIQEIVGNWRFRPGTLNGRAVDVWATIEVTFNLR